MSNKQAFLRRSCGIDAVNGQFISTFKPRTNRKEVMRQYRGYLPTLRKLFAGESQVK